MSKPIKSSRAQTVGISLPSHTIDFLERWNVILNHALDQNLTWQKRLRLLIGGYIFPLDAAVKSQEEYLEELQYILFNRTAKNLPRNIQVVAALNSREIEAEIKKRKLSISVGESIGTKRLESVSGETSAFLHAIDPHYEEPDDYVHEEEEETPEYLERRERELAEADEYDVINRRRSLAGAEEETEEKPTSNLSPRPDKDKSEVKSPKKPKSRLAYSNPNESEDEEKRKKADKEFLSLELPEDYDPPLNFNEQTATDAELNNIHIVRDLLAKKKRRLKRIEAIKKEMMEEENGA